MIMKKERKPIYQKSFTVPRGSLFWQAQGFYKLNSLEKSPYKKYPLLGTQKCYRRVPVTRHFVERYNLLQKFQVQISPPQFLIVGLKKLEILCMGKAVPNLRIKT